MGFSFAVFTPMTPLYFCVGTRATFNQWLCTTGKPPSALWGKRWRSQLWCATFGLPRPRVHECKKLSSRHSQTRDLNKKRRPQFLRLSTWDVGRPHSRTKISTMQSRSRQGKTIDPTGEIKGPTIQLIGKNVFVNI